MMLKRLLFFHVVYLSLWFCFNSFWLQANSNQQHYFDAKKQVDASSNSHVVFDDLFTICSQQGVSHAYVADLVKKHTLLDLNPFVLKQLMQACPDELRLHLPIDNTKHLVLVLEQHHFLSPNFRSSVRNQKGKTTTGYSNAGLHYKGHIQGKDNTLVAISLFDNNVMAIVGENGGTYTLGRLGKPKSVPQLEDPYVIYNTNDLLITNSFECGTEEIEAEQDTPLPIHHKAMNLGDVSNPSIANVDGVVEVYLECDHDMYQDFGNSSTATENYATGLFGFVTALYDQDSVTLNLSELVVWQNQDPYDEDSSSDALSDFEDNLPTFNGNLAHLLSNDGYGGRAWIDQLCGNVPYGISSIFNNNQPFPTYSWDVNVVSHEMGHNFGSRHTHRCNFWANGPIDWCGPTYNAAYIEGTCSPVSNPSSGTVMSYCHLVNSVGIDFNLGFGPEPGALIRQKTQTAFNNGCIISTPSNTCFGTQTLTASAGSFTDGSGIANYGDNLDCMWLIQPTGAIDVTLNFTAFNTVLFDYVYVYDGVVTTAPLLGSYTGTTLPSSLTSSSGNMLVHFVTNGSAGTTGWAATYSSTFTSNPCDTLPTTTLPLLQDFENSNTYANWVTENDDQANTWSSYNGTPCNATVAHVNNFNYNAVGEEDLLFSPSFDLTGVGGATLNFDVSYAPFSSMYQDGLQVKVRVNCSDANSTLLFSEVGLNLATNNPPDYQQSEWIPNGCADWETQTLDLTPFVGSEIGIHFINVNGWGNNLYIDNIEVTTVASPCDGLPMEDLPYTESFETPSGNNWAITNFDNANTWSVYNDNGCNTQGYFMDNYNYDAMGFQDIITSPVLDLTNKNSAFVNFDVSYAAFSPTTADGLRVNVINQCNTATATTIFEAFGLNLATNPSGTYYINEWIPSTCNDWANHIVDLSPYVGEQIQLQFININAYGNNVYLDNIAFTIIEPGPLVAKAKILLEGAYAGNGQMNSLFSNDFQVTSLTQPFMQPPWSYLGTESIAFADLPNNFVDWVLVELRDVNDVDVILDRKAGFLLADGSLSDLDGTEGIAFDNTTTNGNYYLVVRHRNHLDVMSATAITLPNTIPYDFTTTANQAFGNFSSTPQLLNLGNGHFGLYAGDSDGNGVINFVDDWAFNNDQGSIFQYSPGDLNMDAVISVQDYNLYESHPTIIGIDEIRY